MSERVEVEVTAEVKAEMTELLAIYWSSRQNGNDEKGCVGALILAYAEALEDIVRLSAAIRALHDAVSDYVAGDLGGLDLGGADGQPATTKGQP